MWLFKQESPEDVQVVCMVFSPWKSQKNFFKSYKYTWNRMVKICFERSITMLLLFVWNVYGSIACSRFKLREIYTTSSKQIRDYRYRSFTLIPSRILIFFRPSSSSFCTLTFQDCLNQFFTLRRMIPFFHQVWSKQPCIAIFQPVTLEFHFRAAKQ